MKRVYLFMVRGEALAWTSAWSEEYALTNFGGLARCACNAGFQICRLAAGQAAPDDLPQVHEAGWNKRRLLERLQKAQIYKQLHRMSV